LDSLLRPELLEFAVAMEYSLREEEENSLEDTEATGIYREEPDFLYSRMMLSVGSLGSELIAAPSTGEDVRDLAVDVAVGAMLIYRLYNNDGLVDTAYAMETVKALGIGKADESSETPVVSKPLESAANASVVSSQHNLFAEELLAFLNVAVVYGYRPNKHQKPWEYLLKILKNGKTSSSL
jgi:hypothetical protein